MNGNNTSDGSLSSADENDDAIVDLEFSDDSSD